MQLVLVGGRQLPNKEPATVGGADKNKRGHSNEKTTVAVYKFKLFSIHIFKLKVVTKPWAVMVPMTPS